GTQTIRLIFDEPQRLTRIALVFEETETERTQEFVLRWSPDGGRSFREIVRQQWNFSRPKTIREVEECQVDLSGVTVLELVIVPDISRGAARASLKSLRLSWTFFEGGFSTNHGLEAQSRRGHFFGAVPEKAQPTFRCEMAAATLPCGCILSSKKLASATSEESRIDVQ